MNAARPPNWPPASAVHGLVAVPRGRPGRNPHRPARPPGAPRDRQVVTHDRNERTTRRPRQRSGPRHLPRCGGRVPGGLVTAWLERRNALGPRPINGGNTEVATGAGSVAARSRRTSAMACRRRHLMVANSFGFFSDGAPRGHRSCSRCPTHCCGSHPAGPTVRRCS